MGGAAGRARELEDAREAFAAYAWGDARDGLTGADERAPLGGDDLELLAVASFMLGRVDDYMAATERAHRAHLDAGRSLRAARCAFYLGINLAVGGERARAAGWFGRARRLVDAVGRDCPEHGYLLCADAVRDESRGDLAAAGVGAAAAAEIGARFGDADLFALAVQLQGRTLVARGNVERGLGLLDEAMVAVAAGELSPIITGVVYCGVISACERAYDLRRAREWTAALARWCEEQPDMVAFSGRCLAHRAEILQVQGAWGDALDEAERALLRSARAPNRAGAGQAAYLQGEVHRLRGDLAAAEAAYREANDHGREPQPGLALLRLAQGDARAAGGTIRRALAEAADPPARARLLPAQAEIALVLGDRAAARAAADELGAIAADGPSAMLRAVAAQTGGAVDLAEGDPQAALPRLRGALGTWQELDAPYQAARARELLGLACRALGDDDSAGLELEAAAAAYEALGAAPDLARMSAAARGAGAGGHALTPRELEVLRLVAGGKSNRQIAAELVVSEHTVARHVQNILGKLGLSSRTAAAGFAFEHHLV